MENITTEIIEIQSTEVSTPKLMEFSSFSNIQNILKYLVAIIRTEKDSESMPLTITPYIDENKIHKAQFIVKNSIWCEVEILDKYEGDLIDKSVTVNLYDFYNTIDNCKDEIISLYINEEKKSLVVASFYNDDMETFELEVYLPYSSIYEPIIHYIPRSYKSTTLNISPAFAFIAMKELNVENNVDKINFIFENGKLALCSEYNGVYSYISGKEFEDIDFGDQQNFSIPFSLFYLMTSTGNINGTSLTLTDEYITLFSEGYSFVVPLEDVNMDASIFNIKEYEKLFIINTLEGFAAIEKITNINQTKYINEIEYRKAYDGVADFVANINDRMVVYVRSILATYTDDVIKFDGNLFRDLFTKNGANAIGVNRIENGDLYITYSSPIHTRKIVYNHANLFEHRLKSIK